MDYWNINAFCTFIPNILFSIIKQFIVIPYSYLYFTVAIIGLVFLTLNDYSQNNFKLDKNL